MAAKRSRLSDARKEARELLKRAKAAPVKGGARTKLEKRAGELLRREKLADLRPDEIRARAKTYAGAFGERLVAKADAAERAAKDAKNARARERRAEKKAEAERIEKKRAADRERQRRRREKVKEQKKRAEDLKKPFAVEQEFEDGKGTGELVASLIDQAKPRAWCAAGPVRLTLALDLEFEYVEEAEGMEGTCARSFVLDLARLTSSEGEIVAEWIVSSILAFFGCLGGEDGRAPREYRKGQKPELVAGAAPEDDAAREQVQDYNGWIELFCEPLTPEMQEETARQEERERQARQERDRF